MRRQWVIAGGILALVVLANLLVHRFVVRFDMTDDRRYSLAQPMKEQLRQLDQPLEITCYLTGDVNSGFRRLQRAVKELAEEMQVYADIRYGVFEGEDADRPRNMTPTVIHERQKDGRTAQTTVYPYLGLRYAGHATIIPLLQNNRGMSGEENLNASIENLEYAMAEAIHSLRRSEPARIAFLEGHNELPEDNVYDLSVALSRWFRIDRGVIGDDPEVLSPYRAVIIADPALAFSDKDKFVLDQYLMNGGRILWVVNGVRFSQDILASNGKTPVIAADLNLTDLFFRYGVRINPGLLQDAQCLPIPVNVSSDPQQPNLQPMPWYYAPLLLTSQASPITHNVAQVSCMFASPVDAVGGEDGLTKEILLATSSASRVTGTPAEVDLGDMNPDLSTFRYSYIPVAISVEGSFPSFYANRMAPEGITQHGPIKKQSTVTRQIFVGSGSIIRNEIEHGQALPVGYDRYSGMQFGNRDFLTNAVLWLTDEDGLIALRQKHVELRLLNDKRARDERQLIQVITILCPLLILAIVGLACITIRKYHYTR